MKRNFVWFVILIATFFILTTNHGWSVTTKGMILNIQGNEVKINLGENNGIKQDTILYIYRVNVFIGKVMVIKVDKYNLTAKTMPESEKMEIGDIVLLEQLKDPAKVSNVADESLEESSDVKKTSEIDTPPIDVSEKNFPSFSVSRIRSLIPPGTILGSHHEGLFSISTLDYSAAGRVGGAAEEEYKESVFEELKNAGYNVAGQPSLFDNDEPYTARFLVGGSITKATLNTFKVGRLSGGSSEASYEVRWEIFDKDTKKVIYKETTESYAKANGVTESVIFISFQKSFRKFLSNPDFVPFLGNYLSTPISKNDTTEKILYYKSNKSIEIAPDKIKQDIKAVFTLKEEIAHGSGFIINPEGYAITNYHVIRGANFFEAVFSDGKIIRAEVIKTFPDKDLALVKLSGGDYPYLPIRNFNTLSIGEEVYAIGTPKEIEYSQSVSKGVISGLRKLPPISGEPVDTIQTDAAINTGNSGGPLIDKNGCVIGINTWKRIDNNAEGLGFAISVDEAIKSFGFEEAPEKENK